MKNFSSFKKEVVAACITCLFFTASAQTYQHGYADGRIYFKIKDDVFFNIPSESDEVLLDHAFFLNDLRKQFRINEIKKSFYFSDSEILRRTFCLKFSDHENIDKIIEGLYKTGIVEYAEKVPLDEFSYTPNDPSMSQQWFLTQINATKAWDMSKGDAKITVAIVDNGVQLTHPDLKDNIWINPGEIAGNGIDDDGNGFIDDINGWDTSDKDNNPNPGTGGAHGTHCAGDAAAVSDNGTGVAGIGFNVSVIAVKIAPNSSPNSPTTGYEGIAYAASVKARVISCSWGSSSFSQTAQNVVTDAYNKGCLVLAAAGNNNSQALYYPAAYTNVLSVASTATGDVKSSFSNYGTWVDIAAPGSNIYSTVPGGYGNMSGTSMACPLAAGLCGLMISLNPAMTPAQVESCLKSSAANIDSKNAGYIGKLGGGRIDAEAALKCVSATLNTAPVAQFAADATTNCTGLVKFTDQSTSAPTSWSWKFGDGGISTQQNPVHTYTASGVYSVTLTATNANGTDNEIKTSYITINKPVNPTVTGDQRCGSGIVNLSATGNYTLNWYAASTGGAPVNNGSTYSPNIASNTTYYVANEQIKPVQKAGEPDNTKTGGYLITTDRKLIFDVMDNVTIKSVVLYANSAGDRTIEVVNSGGTAIATQTVNIAAAGMTRVILNFNLAPGTGYAMKLAASSATSDLYRNNAGGLSYPYTISNLISITTTDASTAPNDYYYFFYDWEVQGTPCMSDRVPVTGSIQACTGIADASAKEAFIVYPNPARDILYVQGDKAQANLQVEIVNLLGETVLKKTIAKSGKFSTPFDISTLKAGVYMIRIVSGEQQTIQRFVKE